MFNNIPTKLFFNGYKTKKRMKKYLTIAMLMLLTVIGGQAQPAGYQAMMDEARRYSQQKEYEKSSECYEKAIELLKGTEGESLIPSVRNFVAINNMHQGIAALKAKDYPKAKELLEKAVSDAKPDSKTYYMANSWMGQWYSVQASAIHSERGDYEEAIRLSLGAERYFDLAQAPEKRLNEQTKRASALHSLSRTDEAEALLKQIMVECENDGKRNFIHGKAAYRLGALEVGIERFQEGIRHLEKAYDLCIGETTRVAKLKAMLAAAKLSDIYSRQIPDTEKAGLWKKRADELEKEYVQ